MKSPTLRLGALPPIKVSPGTLVTVLVLAVILYPGLGAGGSSPATGALLAFGIALFMILSVLVHEASHALSAHGFGAQVDHIALTLWGGHTQYRGEALGTVASMVISLSGPLANGVLAALTTGLGALSLPGTPADVFWTYGSILNIALGLFNLLPGLPMDGGRALEALLGGVLRDVLLGTRVTAWIGRVIAVAVVALPLWRILRDQGTGSLGLLTLLWAMLIAAMLWQGASRALQAATLQHRIRTLDAAALARPMHIVPPGQLLAELGSGSDLDTVLVLDRSAPRPGTVGHAYRIHPAAAEAVPVAQRGRTPVSAVAGSVGEMGLLDASLRGDALISAMLARPVPVYLVHESEGRPRGVIMSADVNGLLRGR
ncbi:site-2 protease family protein [Brachybacterium sacelli]|uniref:Zn-dependent protease n=1 Tax=Brachybacterium sacelli TaxID=173364 RepID=A0ABS4X9E6_9MICO|nr:site-2 protease family protein [Brachybacterium sacelli]MBP2384294.1 Zn-dependent protease [Brachybacterium sacelli]